MCFMERRAFLQRRRVQRRRYHTLHLPPHYTLHTQARHTAQGAPARELCKGSQEGSGDGQQAQHGHRAKQHGRPQRHHDGFESGAKFFFCVGCRGGEERKGRSGSAQCEWRVRHHYVVYGLLMHVGFAVLVVGSVCLEIESGEEEKQGEQRRSKTPSIRSKSNLPIRRETSTLLLILVSFLFPMHMEEQKEE